MMPYSKKVYFFRIGHLSVHTYLFGRNKRKVKTISGFFLKSFSF